MKRLMDLVVSLDGAWELTYAPDSVLKKDGYRARDDASLAVPGLNTREALRKSGYERIQAEVPGNVEADLFRAGKCGDPFFGSNVLELRNFESTHWFYARTFSFHGDPENEELFLEGIDTAAEVFLNGKRVLTCENMFLEYTVPVGAELRCGENELVVHIKPATVYARRYPGSDMTFALPYNYESLHLRKAASTFGWDIAPRICCGGIWRSVSLRRRPEHRIADLFGYTESVDMERGSADLAFAFGVEIQNDRVDEWRLIIEGNCGESTFSCGGTLRHTNGLFRVRLPEARFWMPGNYGEPELYSVRAALSRNGVCVDAVSFSLGIRTVALERSSVVEPDGSGEFRFRINGKPVFAMGTNWVPADAIHSRDRSRLPELLPMLTDLGCNMVRCWGGNVYEHEDFFDFCDRNGIMVWQDFAMGCAVYPRDADFQRSLRTEAEQIVRKYRGHCSLVLWAGDNECDLACEWSGIRRDPNDNSLTRKLLPDVLSELDLTRPYLPSSPYLDDVAYRTGLPTPEDHIWGPRDYFKGDYYKGVVCRFASEVGYHGCPEPASLKRFLSPDHLWGWRAKEGTDVANEEWLVHASCMEADRNCQYAYRIPLMATQVKTLFGEEPEELLKFAAESQISQAEADKYFIESFRIRKAYRSGILWWNLADCWPQISDAVVDYYGNQKLAYFYIRRSQQPVALMCDEPENGEIALVGVNDLQERIPVRYEVKKILTDTVLCRGEAILEPDCAVRLCGLPDDTQNPEFYLITWSFERNGACAEGKNHFVSHLEKTISFADYQEFLRRSGFGEDTFWNEERAHHR